MARKLDFDLFVAGKTGTFKGISINIEDKDTKSIAKNIQNIKVLTKENEITSLAWGDPDEIDVLTLNLPTTTIVAQPFNVIK